MAETIKGNYFQILNDINVNDKTEKKNGLTYLSWAWAWGEVKKMFPDATYTIYENANGCFYHTDGKTCWVKTGVTVCGIEHIEYLPVMDYKNKSIPLENVTSFDINKAIQRSLTKAVARHGLGLYIYAGEDLPENAPEGMQDKKEPPIDLNQIIQQNTVYVKTIQELTQLSKADVQNKALERAGSSDAQKVNKALADWLTELNG